MTDFAVPNEKPGQCAKCRGTGEYRWLGRMNDRAVTKVGPCHSCGGTGSQDRSDIARNNAYNRYKLSSLSA